MGILKRVAHTINTYGNTPINDSNVTPAQIASGVATAGNIVSQVPTFYTKTAGTVLSVPDQIFDVAALIDEPKNSNAGHVILNYAPQLAEILTPNMKYDDYL